MFGTFNGLVSSFNRALDTSQSRLGGFHPPFHQSHGTAVLGSAFEIGTAAMAAAVSQVLGRPASSSEPQVDPVSAIHSLASTLDRARINDCRGLPIPTAAGSIIALGSKDLWIVPPSGCGQSLASLLPPESASSIVHPDVAGAVEEVMRIKQCREVWGIGGCIA